MQYGPEGCTDTLMEAVSVIDKLLDMPGPVRHFVKGLFGLEGLQDNADFGELISSPLGAWQAQNWDPKGQYSIPTIGFRTALICMISRLTGLS